MKHIWGFLLIFTPVFGLGIQSNPYTTLLLTEIYYNTPGQDSQEEWIELANVGTAVLDLSDIKLGDEETAGGNEGMRRFPKEAKIEPGQIVVIAQTAAGFRRLYGRNPDYEILDTDPAVPDMRGFPLWAGGDLALGNDGDEILLIQDFAIIDAISYGDSQAVFTPAIGNVITGQSIERIPADCDTDSAADWRAQSNPTPGFITFEGECLAPANPAETEELPPIGEIQGVGAVSPFLDQMVTFRGIVTGTFEDRNAEGIIYYTLFLQDLPGFDDGDPQTSDGMAVFLGRERPSYQPGDQLRITGLVTEFFGYTEIDEQGLEIIIEANDRPLPPPITFTPPAAELSHADFYEPYESMVVAINEEARVVGPTYSGCGFAIVPADSGLERVFRRNITDPAGPVITVLHHSDVQCGAFPNVKNGDIVRGITGPLIYNFDEFKIVQQAPADLLVTAVPLPELPQPPNISSDQFSIASFNLENHFDAINDTGEEAEPKPTIAEIDIKQTKLAHALGRTLDCPTIVGIQEVEKESLLSALAEETAEICGFVYEVTHVESPDVRGIDLALLTDPRRVMVASASLQQTCTTIDTGIEDENAACAAGKQPLFSRPPLLVDLTVDDILYTIIVNHFKSKRGGESETTPRRLAQANHIVELVNDKLKQDAGARLIILGDFNDYDQSLTMKTMTRAGALVNVLLQIPEEDRYSFIFGGVSQLIDGILVTENIVDDLTAVTILHTNADFPDSLGEEIGPTELPYKATDHDLPLLILELDQEIDIEITPTAVPETAVTPSPTIDNGQLEAAGMRRWLWLIGGLGVVLTAVLAIIVYRHQNKDLTG